MVSEIERGFHKQGYQSIAGVDEAGRGSLAGPVVAAAVMLPIDCTIEGLTDSKKLTEKKRNRLFRKIERKAIAIGIGSVDNREIDRINILQATLSAMQKAVKLLDPTPDLILVDGMQTPTIELSAVAIPKGDSLVQSIAASSVIAKVSRDRLMSKMAKIYPKYGFDRHKGYGTEQHRKAILELGTCEIHRLSFKLTK